MAAASLQSTLTMMMSFPWIIQTSVLESTTESYRREQLKTMGTRVNRSDFEVGHIPWTHFFCTFSGFYRGWIHAGHDFWWTFERFLYLTWPSSPLGQQEWPGIWTHNRWKEVISLGFTWSIHYIPTTNTKSISKYNSPCFSFDAELHLVHYHSDYDNISAAIAANMTHSLAVVGILINEDGPWDQHNVAMHSETINSWKKAANELARPKRGPGMNSMDMELVLDQFTSAIT